MFWGQIKGDIGDVLGSGLIGDIGDVLGLGL